MVDFISMVYRKGRRIQSLKVTPTTTAVLVELEPVNWDEFEDLIDDPGFYSQYHAAILFFDRHEDDGAEFFSTMEEVWEAWEELLQEALRHS